MSIATTVIMISIGTTIVQPIANNQLWKAVGSAAIFMSGRSKIVIENGQINQGNLRAMRMTVDQLEMRLRQKGITNISDVKFATLEPNGQVGYELMRHAKPVTIGEIERMLNLKSGAIMDQSSLFQEVSINRHTIPIDPKLQ
ncbi:DUF421 domain-containing protein [Paenibacillus sp. WST5]|uniref:DUF421 domain-containing protein n=2 Tax=Paenibacillus sedimenti TaxID=2770274 RepID=A0A926KM18_9BACL|nr:DUF421 domain-containing protein [Paenibacillus sedimenti]